MTKLSVFFTAVALLVPLEGAVLPYGSVLEVRLLHRIGSRISHLDEPVEASVIAPFYYHDRLLLPTGVTVLGKIDHIDRIGLGIRHPAARMDLHFSQIRMNDGTLIPFDARVSSIETARESVRTDGAIMGINPTANFSSGASTLVTVFNLAERGLSIKAVALKFLAVRSPDPEINFPAGTEMLLRVTTSGELPNPSVRDSDITLLPVAQIAQVESLLTALPAQQANSRGNRPSDLVNILIFGDRQAVAHSFYAAGWTEPQRRGILAFYNVFHCTVERKGNAHFPMSTLRLNGNVPDLAFEKGLDTFAKRHHIRLWYDDQVHAWLGAATEDIGFQWAKSHMTHAIDRSIDNERAKVVNDLAFTGCIDKGALIPRASLTPEDSGCSIRTDGDIAVVQLNSCDTPRVMPTDPQRPVPVEAIRIASAIGIDIARSNAFSVGYSITKSLLDGGKARANAKLQAKRIYTRPSAIASASAVTIDGSLASR